MPKTPNLAPVPALKERPNLILVGSDKGGVGKSFTTAVLADLLEINGARARFVQIDDQNRLPNLFGDRVTTIAPLTLVDQRADPNAVVQHFDRLYQAIEVALGSNENLIVDIGGPQQQLVEQYLALVDVDADLVEAGARTIWVAPTTAEAEAMRGGKRTLEAVGRCLPSAERFLALNQRDGWFRFYPGTQADLLWQDLSRNLSPNVPFIRVPAITAGAWLPFEAAGKRMIDVVAADIPSIRSWTGASRPMAKVMRGDVAAFLADASNAFSEIINPIKGSNND